MTATVDTLLKDKAILILNSSMRHETKMEKLNQILEDFTQSEGRTPNEQVLEYISNKILSV